MEKTALGNIRVLDLSRVLAGPFCTMLMADMGAEVIKIEVPKTGDDTRGFGPFKNGESLYYANVNRNKKGITLNLKSEKGKEIFKELVKTADVVVENYRPGVMERLGLGYDTLSEINDQIIYGEISGFGSYGPYSDRPGYDIIAQAMGGLMSISGWEDSGPTRSGNAMGDVLGGLSLTIGILAALNARRITGKGQKVDISLVDSVVASLETCTQRYFASGKPPKRTGNRYTSTYPYDSFATKDGSFVLGCGNQKLYTVFCCEVLEREELVSDKRFESIEKRIENHAALKRIIEEWSKNYTTSEVVDKILSKGVPAAPIMGIEDIVNDEHIAKAREMFVKLPHPKIGDMYVNGNHIKMSDTMPKILTPAPELGQDNEAVYGGILGIDNSGLETLRKDGII